MSDDLIAFLSARLDEDASDVHLISPGGFEPDIWRVEPKPDPRAWAAEVVAYSRCLGEPIEAACRDDYTPVALVQLGRNEHRHVTRYDPHRMALEIDVKRRILDVCAPTLIDVTPICTDPAAPRQTIPGASEPWGLPVLRLLALPYSNHPDYREEWKP